MNDSILGLRKALGDGGKWRRIAQQVTCKTALVSSGLSFSASIASMVGRASSLILRRMASRFTSSITGNLPYAPVPTIKSTAFPRNLLFDGKRRVTEFVPEFF